MSSRSDATSGGVPGLPAGCLRCKAKGTAKADDVLVLVNGHDVDHPLPFFVDRGLVRSREGLESEREADAEVRVVVLERGNETTVVRVLGDPVSFGPKVIVSSADLSG